MKILVNQVSSIATFDTMLFTPSGAYGYDVDLQPSPEHRQLVDWVEISEDDDLSAFATETVNPDQGEGDFSGASEDFGEGR